MADFALPLVLSSEDLYGQFSVRNAKFKYLPSRGVRLVPGYTLYSSYVVLFATMTPNILISSVKIIFRHKSWNTFTEVFHYFPTMRCIFDNSGFWAIFSYSSHDASSSDLVFSHTLWRHQSFRETIHLPLHPIFNIYTSFVIETNCSKFKRVNVLSICYIVFILVFLRSRVSFSFQEPTLSYKSAWLLFQGRHAPLKLFADCGVYLTSSAQFRTFIWTVNV